MQSQTSPDPAYEDTLRRKQLESLHSLDTAIGTLLDTLSQYGLDDNTVVMYLSDNAVFWGEHRLDGKMYA